MACRPPVDHAPAFPTPGVRPGRGRADVVRGVLAALALAATLGAGCSPRHTVDPAPGGGGAIGDRPTDPGAARAAAAWPFRPASMRIHPLSRIVTDASTGHRRIEVRIEFRDAWDDPCKCLGEVQVDLHDDTTPGAAPLLRGYRDLRDLGTNARHFEPVTRTYVLRLDAEIDFDAVDPSLRVYFLGPEGTTLQDRLLLQRP